MLYISHISFSFFFFFCFVLFLLSCFSVYYFSFHLSFFPLFVSVIIGHTVPNSSCWFLHHCILFFVPMFAVVSLFHAFSCSVFSFKGVVFSSSDHVSVLCWCITSCNCLFVISVGTSVLYLFISLCNGSSVVLSPLFRTCSSLCVMARQ